MGGLSFLRGQVHALGKPSPAPTYSWSVVIPDGATNLYASQPFSNGNTSSVTVTKGKSSDLGVYFDFWLTVYQLHPSKLFFRNVVFGPITYSDSGTPCVFPVVCNPPAGPPACLQCFLEDSSGHPNSNYEKTDITIRVYRNIESMLPGSTIWLGGDDSNVRLGLTPSGTYHNAAAVGPLDNSSISRSQDGKSWAISISEVMSFWESYKVPIPGSKKGAFTPYIPFRADTSGYFNFHSVWTRTTQ
jgi:hypothetical protein